MADRMSKQARSRVMSSIRSKDTKPELHMAGVLEGYGLGGFRHNVRGLPGTPDFLWDEAKLVVQYHSRFWHTRNPIKIMRAKPFWRKKFINNWKRDVRSERALRKAGYTVLVVWGDDYKRPECYVLRIKEVLHGRNSKRG